MTQTFKTESKNNIKIAEIRLAHLYVNITYLLVLLIISISVIDHLIELFKQIEKITKDMNVDKFAIE